MIQTASEYKNNRIAKNILYLWCVIVAAGHMLLACFQYIIDYTRYIYIIRWAGLGLLIAAFIGFFFSLLFSKESRTQALRFLKRILSFEQIVLLLLLGWFVVSLYTNGRRISNRYLRLLFLYDDWLLFDMAVCFLILFTVPRAFGANKGKEFLEILIHITVIIYTVFTIVCLWHIFHLEVLDFPSGEQGGMTVSYQLMLGKHYNLTGMISAGMLCMCIYMIVVGDKWVKALYLGFAIAQLLVIYLSNSRTVFVGLIAFAAAAGFALPWHYLDTDKIWKRLLFSICISFISIVLLWIGRTIVFDFFEKITHFKDALAAEAGELTLRTKFYSPTVLTSPHSHEAHAKLLASNAAEEIRQLDSLSDRELIWRAAFKSLGHDTFTTLFGVTPLNVTSALTENGFSKYEAAHAHNSILQVGVSMGMPAMCLLLVFLSSLACRCVRIIFNSPSKGGTSIIAASILCFVVINMAEAYLIAYFSFIACTFFLFSGTITAVDEETIESQLFVKNRLTIPMVSTGISVLLCLALTFYSGNYLNVNSRKIAGSGTVRDPYLIVDSSDLKYFRDLVNHGNTFRDQFFAQTDNIDLEMEEWSPIGVYGTKKRFEGVYNGTFHTIKNLNVTKLSGLFGNLRGTVKNLYIKDATINGVPFEYNLEIPSNLLEGTNNGVQNFQLVDQGYSATLEPDGEGVKVTSTTKEGEKKWLLLFYYDDNSKNILAGPAGEKYTISFEAKSNIKDALIKVSHKQSNALENQITFGTALLENADEWTQVVLTGSLEGVAATVQGIYLDIRDNPAGTEFSIRNLKLEKGEVATTWVPAATDPIALSGNVIG